MRYSPPGQSWQWTQSAYRCLGGVTCYSGPDPGPRVLRRIALAGPKTSLLTALGCLLFLVAEGLTGWRSEIGSVAAWGLQANLALGLVNLLPVGSLDGAALRSAGPAGR